MHPYICEVARDLERLRHPGVVGNAEGDSGPPQQVEDRRHEPGVVPELEREAHVRRQHADESREAFRVEVKVRLELKEKWAQLLAEAARGVDDQVDGFGLDREPL